MKGSTWVTLFLLVALGVVGYMWFANTNQPGQVAEDINRTGDRIGNNANDAANQTDDRTGQLSDVATGGVDLTGKNAKACTECHKPGSNYSLSNEAKNIKGHPKVSGDDYATCIKCHGGEKDYAFKFILHTAHLKQDSHFVTNYNGQCTTCHQMQENGKIVLKTS